MKFLPLALLACCLVLSQAAFSQQQRKPVTKTDIVEYSKLYFYTFSGEAYPGTLDALKQDLLNIPSVQEVKVEYKPEKNAGQLKVITKEKVTTQEHEDAFGPVKIKQVLIARNLSPGDFRIEDYNN